MGLTMGQRKAVTKAIATRYRRADKAGKSRTPIPVSGCGSAHQGQPAPRVTGIARVIPPVCYDTLWAAIPLAMP